MEQQLIQPAAPEVTKELQWTEWFPEGGMMHFCVRFRWPGEQEWEWEDKEHIISRDMEDFNRLLPDGEYSFEEEETVFARMDDFHNLHFLLKDYSGKVFYRVVNIKPILEEIAEEKL